MSSMDYVELLRRRSEAFYRQSRKAFEGGDYDVAVFLCEQAAQIRLKALLLRLLGFTPRGHGIREMLGLLSKVLEKLGRAELAQRVAGFGEARRGLLRLLEEAYTSSRYLPRSYSSEEAAEALGVVEELLKLIEGVEGGVFGG